MNHHTAHPHTLQPVPEPARPGDQEACEEHTLAIAEQLIDIQSLTGYPLQIRPTPTGRGVFATRHIAPGETVLEAAIHHRVPERTDTSFEIWPGGSHAELDWPAWRINHSCRPNTGIQDLPGHNGYRFVAGPDGIPADAEILTHYGMHEWHSIAVGDCLCGAPDCIGTSHGWGQLPPLQRQTFAEAYGVADHLTRPETVRGLAISIQLHGCATPLGVPEIERYITQLCADMGVRSLPDTRVVKRYGDAELFGWTWTQLISASSIAGHHYEHTRQAWIDLITCRPCDAEALAQSSARYWRAAAYTVTSQERA